MTREQAIEELKDKAFTFCNFERCVDFYSTLNCERCEEALKMAIKALEQEQERQEDIYECPNCLGEVHKNYVYCPFCGKKVESEEE